MFLSISALLLHTLAGFLADNVLRQP